MPSFGDFLSVCLSARLSIWNERKIYSPGLANTGKRRTGETERAMRKTMRCTKELGNKLACEKEREGRDNKGKRMGRADASSEGLKWAGRE